MQQHSRKAPVALGDLMWRTASGSIAVEYTNPLTGKAERKVARGARTEREAREWREERIFQLRSRRAFAREESMAELASRWLASRAVALEEGQISTKTYQSDELRVSDHSEVLHERPGLVYRRASGARLPRGAQDGALHPVRETAARKTRADRLTALSQVFDFKLSEENGGFNPCRGRRRPRGRDSSASGSRLNCHPNRSLTSST